jgi:3-deoxy-manno-octulosonate cytidylyltransferase (CMP-KDO synthetase)
MAIAFLQPTTHNPQPTFRNPCVFLADLDNSSFSNRCHGGTMAVYGVIPARLKSTRLPRKLLLSETGRPLIQYVWERARQATSLSDVIIAADSEEIAVAVRQFGGRCELTGDHPSGTDRIAEVVRRFLSDAELVVNIQGDEPEINPANIDALVATLRETPSAEMATLATPMTSLEQVQATSCVKVVRAADGRALYFSRSVIPYCRDREPAEVLASEHPWLLHVGIYAYRRDFLLKWAQWPPSRLEQLEKLEQLRALEAGARIQVTVVEHHSVGIDTPEDYAAFVKRLRV